MSEARITSQGQITIPKAVRDVLQVDTGDRVAFRIERDGRIWVEAVVADIRELRGRLKPRRTGVSIEDMNETIRRHGSKT